MQHHVRAAQGAIDGNGIGNISNDEFGVLVEIGGAMTLRAMDLGREVVEKPDFVASSQQGIRGMRADEPGASRDQYSCHRLALLARHQNGLQPFIVESGKHALKVGGRLTARYSQTLELEAVQRMLVPPKCTNKNFANLDQ